VEAERVGTIMYRILPVDEAAVDEEQAVLSAAKK
jgi:hypothetical protein